MPEEPTENAVNSGDHVVTLRRADGATVYLLGTCHVSATSASEASALVREVRPSTVVLELCPSRRSMMYETSRSRAKDAGLPPPPRRRRNTTTKSEVTNTLWNVLTDWTEAISLQYAALDSLVGETNEVGAEFRAANDAAISVGAEVVLGDRAVALTQLRLKRLVPAAEWVYVLFYGDGELWRRRCFERMEAAKALNRTVDDLLRRVGEAEAEAAPAAAPAAVPAAEVARLGEALRRQADEALNAAAPDFCDAALMDVLVRFWWYDSIGAHQQRQLREALNRMGAVDLGDLALPPTARRVLLEERDIVLAHALKEAPGPTVVGVVGRAHVDGIQRLWDADTAALLPPALAEPRRPFERYAVGAGALVAVPLAAWRWRAARLGIGALGVGAAGGAAWLVSALQSRVRHFERTFEQVE